MTDPLEQLRAVHPLLLALHKSVLDAERRQVESVHGPMTGAEFLQLVSDPLRSGWLKPLSGLLLAIDDTLDPREDEPHAEPQELLDRARELVLPPKDDTPFGRRYVSLMQRDPALVTAHSDLKKTLGRRG